MELPTILSATLHRHGGRITRIERIGHTCDKSQDGRSRDYWYFIGDVDWRDGGHSTSIEIAPYSLCNDGENQTEVRALCTLLNDYLEAHGTYYYAAPHEGWYATVRPGPKVRKLR